MYLEGGRGYSWLLVPRQVMGLQGRGVPAGEIKGRVLAFAQEPNWGLPTRTPLWGVPAHLQTPCRGVKTGSPSVSGCAQAQGAATSSLPGGGSGS